jgi:hypothetical protein
MNNSKAFVQLSDPLDSTILGGPALALGSNESSSNTSPTNNNIVKYGVIILASIVILAIIITLYNSYCETEQFNSSNVSRGFADSTPMRIDSNTTMCDSGTCNKPILKNRGYTRPFSQTKKERRRDRKNRRVRWSDPLIEVAQY